MTLSGGDRNDLHRASFGIPSFPRGYEGIIDLSGDVLDFRVPSFVRAAANRAIDSQRTRYTSNLGLIELRKEISEKLRRENRVDVDPEKEIIVTAGEEQAISIAISCLLNEGDEVILPTPLVPDYKQLVESAAGKVKEVRLDEAEGYRLDIERLEKCCTPRTKMIIINSPCNPTGAVFTSTDIEKVCEFAINHDLYVLSDEVYEKFLYDGAQHFSPASVEEFKRNVITVNSFSKTYAMTGWGLAYVVGNERVIEGMTRLIMYTAVCPSSFIQEAGVAALRRKHNPLLGQILNKLDARRRLVCNALEDIGFEFVKPAGAFYVFPKISQLKIDSVSFCEGLLSRYRIGTVPGSHFGDGGEGHFRISLVHDEGLLEDAMKKIGEFKKNL